MTGLTNELRRIEEALDAAERVLSDFTPGKVDAERKSGGDPVTAADHAVDGTLRRLLPRDGEGWFSEETLDDLVRLEKSRVWIVDPLDGTKEFVTAIPEWCVSVGLVEDGVPVAGGILNPASGERIVGARDEGVFYNGAPAKPSTRKSLEGGVVLASRSEVKRGEWAVFEGAPFEVRAMGSVAYKLALVAAGRADATWTIVPKNEWDVAAGTALVLAGGGRVWEPGNGLPRFNRKDPLLRGLVAHPAGLEADVRAQIDFALSRKKG
jgi:myo-inositol-1(or 4)-monophosphatase